ncbi:4-hydroxythreonine-4-phosphate dehydrogenase [Alcanivorax sp. 97CO-5]|uniref:4-hydroxythreonine-4-phosphate dehydrogenase PdxA n=1 Tax=unclassified Alcanivorax TaxID=2638842 RepID=UPI0003E8036C|nr:MULTISPECIES: 4-hydroxythreonine-4-phosphate dehydrogenase PdxA [unclassified Alcanivorax]EUC68279.1 4-hydroxythreonine-4-phosphate dehydrogenase [Alcanivorax sp. 97CO-5]PKG00645.1 4-hydroxythreonine-4-phosphate dehydrogenase PdxA [Alcanivorax sp. 97CO-6]
MPSSPSQPIAITYGDPAGVGPDLVLSLLDTFSDAPMVIIGDRQVLSERAQQLGLTVALSDWQPGDLLPVGSLPVWHTPAGAPVIAGQPDPATAAGTVAMLTRAAQGCLKGTFSAMVTAPVAKNVICDGADPAFTGHTEFLAEQAGVNQVVMMLTASPGGQPLRVALATTHLPLSQVPAAITPDSLMRTLTILRDDLISKYRITEPRIMVLGLNPHAGEEGHLGREELDVIIPTLKHLRAKGMQLTGPLPADTAFQPHLLEQHDAVLAMYHDQGLPVLKYAGFGEAINITLGLPFIRTSVDHGTAFDLAGNGTASAGSLIAATRLALTLATPQHNA